MTDTDSTRSTGNGMAHPSVGAHIDQISHSAEAILQESKSLVSDIAHDLDIPGQIDRHPYRTLAIAAGIGFVLGGGLFSSLTASLFRTGLKVAALPLIQSQLAAVVSGAIAPEES